MFMPARVSCPPPPPTWLFMPAWKCDIHEILMSPRNESFISPRHHVNTTVAQTSTRYKIRASTKTHSGVICISESHAHALAGTHITPAWVSCRDLCILCKEPLGWITVIDWMHIVSLWIPVGMLLTEYQSNDIENYFVLFLIGPIRFSNLTGCNRPCLPDEMGDFLQKAPFENLQKQMKTASKISLSSPS